jgi:hypothetical protein
MTTRERNLATVLATLVALFGIFFVANSLFLQPFNSLRAEVGEREIKKNQIKSEIKAEQTKIARIVALSPRLGKWEELSLPEGDRRPEAHKAHLSRLRVEYQRYLEKLMRDSGFRSPESLPGDFDGRTTPTFARDKPIYQTLTMTVKGDGDLKAVVNFLEKVYRAPLLHQVKNFTVATMTTSSNLTMKMTLEALLVTGAETIDERARFGLTQQSFASLGKQKVPRVVLTRLNPMKNKGFATREAFANNLAKYLKTEELTNYETVILNEADREKDQAPRGPGGPGRGRGQRGEESFAEIFHKFTGKDGDVMPVVLAPSNRRYQDIVAKNMFVPPRDPRDNPDRPQQRTQEEDPEKVLVYVRVTSISYSNYYGCWVARINHFGNWDSAKSGPESALLIDAPLPKGTEYQAAKERTARRRAALRPRPGAGAGGATDPDAEPEPEPVVPGEPEEPVQTWTIKDRYKGKVIDLQVVRIEPLQVIIQADGKFYALAVGDPLAAGLDEPLTKEDLKKRGLVQDRGAVLKSVKMLDLVFKKDRNGFEGQFVNPENKDEKKALALLPIDSELFSGIPSYEWKIKDRLGNDVLTIEIKQADKDRLIFETEKKLYSIRKGETLEKAMAKPLTDAEIKALKLK